MKIVLKDLFSTYEFLSNEDYILRGEEVIDKNSFLSFSVLTPIIFL